MVQYLVFLTISTAIFALFGLGLNLQWGFTGLINFGHVAFMTLGAYTTVLLSDGGWPIALAVPAGALLAALLGLIVGASTLRLREDYLAIVTIGTSEMVRLVALNEEDLTRGAFGLQGYPLPLDGWQPNDGGKRAAIAILTAVAGLALWLLWRGLRREWLRRKQDGRWQQRYPLDLLCWALVALALGGLLYYNGVLALWNYSPKAGLMLLAIVTLGLVYTGLEVLVRSPWGRVLKSIREDENIPRALGKNVFWYKLQAFMLGGAIAGVAGAFYAWQLNAVYPSNFIPIISFYGWTIVVLGGAGNNAGVLLGAVIFWAYESLTRFVLPGVERSLSSLALPDGSWLQIPVDGMAWLLDDARLGALRILVIGLILMVLMTSRPQGILGRKEELTLGR
ncbi:ABC-type branched-chain amino acid transport system, permease component [Rubidibacter lacunae KORDI 51-2]|uniref:ABC-type branched-chain amino acid transport system, permease component n=1 Tax=Rubidibacter lacunae KORDI 51-2 TaxID=582515 RepID=U5DMH8_9CHRO|nr:branched-chain amino acid ABC transporter permease [Rubidibacter lacunae]ERN40910.1 ABC-type branched-chain amino acid transport system, permease component [Rubidibacter lacunae KORDI 51-2]